MKHIKTQIKNKIPISEAKLDLFYKKAVKNKKGQMIRDTIRYLGINGVEPTEKQYFYLAKALAKSGDVKSIQVLIDTLKSNDQIVSDVVYCEMIYANLHKRDVANAWNWYYQMIKDGVKENENTLLAGLAICYKVIGYLFLFINLILLWYNFYYELKDKDSRKAVNMLEQYEHRGGLPTKAIFNSCMAACASSETGVVINNI